MKSKIIHDAGIDCPRCGRPTQIREHKQITDKQRRQPFYYSRWFFCLNRNCRATLIMRDEFRVWNDNDAARKLQDAETNVGKVSDAILNQLTPPGGVFDAGPPPWED